MNLGNEERSLGGRAGAGPPRPGRALQAHRRGNDNAHRRTRTRPVLQTSILPRVIAEYQPGKLATTETRQALIFGSLSATLVLGASGPERATAFVPTSTATVVVDTARPFTTISVVAEFRSFGPAAKEPLGACAGDSTGRDVGAPVGSGTSGPVVGAPVGSGAGAVSEELAVFGATTGGVDALVGSSDSGRGGAGGAVGMVSTGWLGATSVSVSACDSAALDHNVAAKATESKTPSSRINRAMISNPSEIR